MKPLNLHGQRRRAMLSAFTAGALGAAMGVRAQAGKNDALLQYNAADREAKLVDGAKKEGQVVIYTSLATTESVPLTQAFEKKYGVKAELWRALSDKVVQRTITEAQARRNTVDVVETNGPELEMITREKLLSPFYSPYIADLPPYAIPAHRNWVSDRMNFFVVAYNTSKVKREEIPKTYEGFLDPKWKGRIGIEATDSEWMAAIFKQWGETKAMDFFRKLADMKPDMRKGHILLAELVSAGEVPVALSAYNANAESLKRRGGPIDWVPVEPVIARPQGLGIARNAPHPHAALLFADFVLSPDGQQLFNSLGRVPASLKVKSNLNNFKYTMADPAIILDESAKWEKLWDDLFMHR
ncbi:MAG TPA: extracellular solute-binding protein [Casimicrobiaceae bacterium]|nr:extracellular solute-binding protein [Casimicrobiaceae bacterium]